MSSTITLKNTMARSTDAVQSVSVYSLLVLALLAVLGYFNVVAGEGARDPIAMVSAADVTVSGAADVATPVVPAAVRTPVAETSDLSPSMQGALDYVTRRYRVSEEALVPVFELAQMVGKERRIDPLLIVAIIGIESGFNPFAESSVGAQGLMQVIPRFHMDKVPPGTGERSFLNPLLNIRVGVDVLQEAIRRRGGLIPGLQYYAGSTDAESTYANKVLAEKARLEQAVRRSLKASA